jgi:carbonic anhydrase
VSPELSFSAGLGELFVVRVAGNIVDDRCFGVLGSLEYAVEELRIPLMLVLGHEECGAVKAAIRAVQKGISPKGALGSIVDALRPALESLTDRNPQDLVRQVVKANVKRSVDHLLNSHVALADAVAGGRVKVVGGIYELHTGRVQMLGGIAP